MKNKKYYLAETENTVINKYSKCQPRRQFEFSVPQLLYM